MNKLYIASSTNFSILDRSASNPFAVLFEELESLGYSLTTDPLANYFLSLNYSPKGWRRYLESAAGSKSSVLIALEPEVVFPGQYKRRVTSKFNAVLVPGFANSAQGARINWPYTYSDNPLRPVRKPLTLGQIITNNLKNGLFSFSNWEKREYKCTMIAANKVSNSRKSNYKLRRNLVRMYTQDELAVFGQLWESSMKARLGYRFEYSKWLLSFRILPNLFEISQGVFVKRKTGGEINDKQQVLANSKFSVIIENSNEVVTEKIFDAFMNGTIPIYFGPDISLLGISRDCYIVLDDISSLIDYCDALSESQIENYLENIKNFVRSDFFQNSWGADHVWREVARRVHLTFGIVS